MKLRMIFTFALVLMFAVLDASDAVAQEVYDPLKKPHLWRDLTNTPENDELWAEYMGKDWKDMTEEDKRYIAKWKKAIAEDEKPKFEAYVSNKFNSMDELLTWERMIMEESNRITDLKSNVAANFLLIEDTFTEIFEELDRDYRRYDDVHTNGNYLQVKWVEDHENKINYIKEQIIATYKKRYGVKN